MFDSKIELQKEALVTSTCDLIRIPSVYSESSKPGAPFGEAIAQALEFTLSLANTLGFRSKNIDGYCGYIEFGEGEELVGIIGHLDVVGVNNDWSYSPFGATIVDGKIYGRGAIDDKGPVIAALYAMKAVMDSCKVKKRVRLILGTNEERDWKCIHYYKLHEEIPTIGFSPDADFPCIYAEKALLTVYLTQDYTSDEKTTDILIQDINCHNNAINVVPKQCDITLKLSNNIIVDNVISDLKQFLSETSYSMEIISLGNHMLRIESHGTAAHAAHPDLGSNAISHLLVILHKVYQKYHVPFDLLDFFISHIGDDYTGQHFNINFQDESGALTLNTAQFDLKNHKLSLGLNLRIPVHTKIDTIKKHFEIATKDTSVHCLFSGEKDALYISKDHYLVQTLCKIYNEYTHSALQPIPIGGATYARAFPKCISFGANFPGHKDMCHQADEYIEIDHLLLASKIYAKAIYELAK